MELSLPLTAGSGVIGEGVNTVPFRYVGVGQSFPAAAGCGILEDGMGAVGRQPQVALGVVLEAVELHGAFLGGEDEMPGDAAVVVHQHQAGGLGLQHFEAGFGPEVVVVDVGEQRVGRENQVQVVALYLKAVSGRLRIYLHVVVGGSTRLLVDERRYGDTVYIHIGGAVVAGIIGIAVIPAEGDFVFVHAEGILVAGLGAPPLQTF